MNLHAKLAAALVVLGALAIVAFKFAWPLIENRMQLDTSDAKDTKGKLSIGVDNWVGYFPLCSGEMKKRLRSSGYVLNCDDDKADYAKRMQRLKNGELQFAVATIDAYLLNGAPNGFPGTIVAVIDESKGGDAIVAWRDRVATLDALKNPVTPKVAFTPGSPSEHLLRSAAVHFDIPALMAKQGAWRVETDGSPDALAKLNERKVDAAVLWEPDVTRALGNPGIVKLLGTGDTDKLIVDVLIVSRTFSQQQPEAVAALLSTYFQVLKHYRDNAAQLEKEVAEATKIGATDKGGDKVRAMLSGVAWVSLSDNFQLWLGTTSGSAGLVDAIQSTVKILIDSKTTIANPLPEQDPYRIINRQFLAKLYVDATTGGAKADAAQSSLDKRFAPLNEAAWGALKEVGTLKAVQVMFQSGTAELNYDGKSELDRVMEIVRHYPNFRIQVKGHTGLGGDAAENKRLSQERADSVARYLNVTYSVDQNRLRVLGLGAEQPLPRLQGEADRAYNYRLPRVELSLLSEVF